MRTDEGSGSLRWVFSLRELRSATNSFNYDNKIGEGPLGSVYWGQVWDGSQIAVKKLKNAKKRDINGICFRSREFGEIRHKNLIPDGTDHDKIISENQRGYLAPEYIMFGKPTAGCDVYRFGIILLELTTGRKPIEKSGSVKMYGVRNWVLPLAKEGRCDEIAGSKLNDKYSESELKRVVLIGLACTHTQPEKKPTMLEVVSLLKGESKEMLLRPENDELFRPDSMVSSYGMSTPESRGELRLCA